eukprot:7193642-Prymnesium_polylepis.1
MAGVFAARGRRVRTCANLKCNPGRARPMRRVRRISRGAPARATSCASTSMTRARRARPISCLTCLGSSIACGRTT